MEMPDNNCSDDWHLLTLINHINISWVPQYWRMTYSHIDVSLKRKCDWNYDFHDFNDSHFEFSVNQQPDNLSRGTIDFFVPQNMGVDTNIMSLSILEAELKNIIFLILMAAIFKMTS